MANHPQRKVTEHQGRVESLAGKNRIVVAFDNPIRVTHELGDKKVSKISLRYDLMQKHYAEWAEKHPYSPALVGDPVPVKESILYAAVSKHHQKQLTGALETIENGDSDEDEIPQKEDFLNYLNGLKE